jgi:hypothetical protein
MQAPPKPHVLIVDDQPDTQRPFKTELEHQIDVTLIHPDDVTKEDLSEADLALIDFRIED